MKDLNYSLSTYIANGIVKRNSNTIMEKIIGFFFRKVDFDKESLSYLNEFPTKGKIVYVSFQSTISTLLILSLVLKKNGMPVPFLALDFKHYIFQRVSNIFKAGFRIVKNVFVKKKPESITNEEFLQYCLQDDRILILSLLSRKLFKRRYLDIESDTLQALIEIQKKSDVPIYLFPKIMFWNRNPEKTKGLLTARATGDRSLMSAILSNLRSTTPSFLRISPPINIKEELEQSSADDVKQLARMLRNKLLESYNHEKRSILGPVIKSQQEMIEKVLFHQNVMDTIQELVKQENKSEKKLRKLAFKYYKEIAADFSILYIKFFDWSLKYVFSKIFDGISYNIEDFKKIREASQNGPLILMPSHKSHMDYLILSSIFYQNKLIPPHIVAGSNLTFFPMGKIFRRSGAFFMRRSFKGLNLYAMVFRQYIKTLINEGYSIEFFIEGGRTRTGRLVAPKMGILKYLIESIDEGYNKDMVFVPMSINYDRILEESAYMKEIKGKEKKSESTSAFVKSRKLLKRQYGRVYLTFDEPISYQDLKKKFAKEEDVTADIGHHIIKKINNVIMVTPFSITTSAILLSSSKGFTKDLLKEKIVMLHDFLAHKDVEMSQSLRNSNFDEIIEYVLDSFQKDHIISELEADDNKTGEVDDFGLYVLDEDERARINFYKNNIVHYMVPIAFASLALLFEAKDNKINLSKVKENFKEVMDLFSEGFIFPECLNNPDKEFDTIIAYLDKKSYITKQDGDQVVLNKIEDLKFFAKVMQDSLESYLIVFKTIIDVKNRTQRKDLVYQIRKNGIKMYHLGEVTLLESLSMPNYNTALSLGLKLNLLLEEKKGKKSSEITITDSKSIGEMVSKLQNYTKVLS